MDGVRVDLDWQGTYERSVITGRPHAGVGIQIPQIALSGALDWQSDLPLAEPEV